MEIAKMEIIAFSNDDVIATSGHDLNTLVSGMTDKAYVVSRKPDSWSALIRYDGNEIEHYDADTRVYDSLGNQIDGYCVDVVDVDSYYHIILYPCGGELYWDGAQLCDNPEHHYQYQ